MNVDDDLLVAAKAKRDNLRKVSVLARQHAEDAEEEYRRVSDAVAELERLKGEQDDFNRAAGSILG